MNLQSKSTKRSFLLIFILWLCLTGWWAYINFIIDPTDNQRYAFGALYGLMALSGAVYGVMSARKWGGTKSALGTALLMLGLGLGAAEFGQLAFSYYNIIKGVEIPYPSIADVGFFGAIPLYVIAALSVARVVGTKYSMKTGLRKFIFLLIPLAALGVSYAVFLRTYEFEGASALRVFLDFGYPLGQALYVCLALLIYVSTLKTLGGVMKRRILLLLAAFAVQYAADFNFLYQTLHGTWVNAAYGDYLYFVAYTLMATTLVLFSYIPSAKQKVADQPERPAVPLTNNTAT